MGMPWLFSLCAVMVLSQAHSKNIFEMSVQEEDTANSLREFYGKKTDDRQSEDFSPQFQLAKHFQSNMVLQRGPSRPTLYGFSNTIGEKVIIVITVEATSDKYYFVTNVTKGPGPLGGVWSVMMMPMEGNTVVKIQIINQNNFLTLSNVIFGDVWLCSGQSNMQFPVQNMFNASEEFAMAQDYPNVRLIATALTQSPTPLYDLAGLRQNWASPSNETLKGFSAVCWLFGRMIHNVTGVAMGMVSTEWGGTPVEAWSSPDALKKCGVTDQEKFEAPSEEDVKLGRVDVGGPSNNSVLWNAMIHPFLQMTTYGAIWYQGEANSKSPVQMNRYNCTFPAMIEDWREKFSLASSGATNVTFPFGFVQLAANQDDPTVDTGFSDIRWHQTADVGYVPNPKMENVFMAVAYDLPDFNSPFGSVHPRDKLDVGHRLSYGGLSLAYDITREYLGPFPQNGSLTSQDFTIKYGNKWTLDIRDDGGFEFLCPSANGGSTWEKTKIIQHTSDTVVISASVCTTEGWGLPTHLRYNWRVSPCAFKKCAIYSIANELPAGPFVFELKYTNGNGIMNVQFNTPMK